MDTLLGPLRARLVQAPFLRNVSLLLGGAGVAQVLGLLSAPLIARLYLPSHFGQLGVYMAFLGMICPVAMLRYELAIPACPEDRQAAHLWLLALALAGGTALLTALGLATPWVRHTLARSGFVSGYWILPLGIVAMGLYTASTYWAVRRSDFQALAQTKATQGLGMVVSQILAGWARWRPEGLLAGHLLGQSGGVGRLGSIMYRRDRSLFLGVGWGDLWRTAKTFSRFPRLSVPAVLIESLVGNLPVLVLAWRFGAVTAGWITLVQRTFWVPLVMLTNNITQVNFAEFARMRRENPADLERHFLRRLRHLALLGVALGALVALAGQLVIRGFFGSEWGPSLTCLWIMLPMAVASFITSPFGCLMDAFGRQDLHLRREMIRGTVTVLPLFLIMWTPVSWVTGLAWISLAGVLGSLVYLWACHQVIIQHQRQGQGSASEESSRGF